jgi:hypothetical protein
MSQPAAHDFSTIEPKILDEDMRPSDLVFALEHLHFGRNALGTLRIDRQVRDYLVAALRRHRAARVVR